jgi:hypothetical protein
MKIESPENKVESIEVIVESLIAFVLSLKIIDVEPRGVVSPESEGAFSNPASGPLGELCKTISLGSFKDANCCSLGMELSLFCRSINLLMYSAETVLKQASNQTTRFTCDL